MLVIRAAKKSDIIEIGNVHCVTREHNLPYLPKIHTFEEVLEYFKEKVFIEDRIIVADKDGKIIGFCAFKEGWIDHLYILPEYQGRGTGTVLLNKAKEAYHHLQLWVFQKNAAARTFYEKNGFVLKLTTDGSHCEEHEPDALYSWFREDSQ